MTNDYPTCCPWKNQAAGGALTLFASATLIFFMGGCGGGGKVGPSAKNEIGQAKNAIDSAANWARSGDYDLAVGSLEGASEAIRTGLKRSGISREKRTLDSLAKDVSKLKAEYELKKKKSAEAKMKEAEKKTLEAEVAKLDKKSGKGQKSDGNKSNDVAVDPAELERQVKQKLEAKAKVDEEDLKKLVSIKEDETAKKGEDETAKVTKAKGGDGELGEEKEGEKEGGKEKAPVETGPFRNYGDNPPDMSIDKVSCKGDFALVYIQVFNKDANAAKRIGRIFAEFRDEGNGKLMEAVAAFEFEKFSMDVKDLTDQPDGSAAVLAGSHHVQAGKSLKLIAVAQDTRYAKKARKAAVTIMFNDGKEISDSGPGSLVEESKKAAAIPGL